MYAHDADGKNVYNRSYDKKPTIRIGNWVEELALWEEQQRRKITGVKETSANTIVDLTCDIKAQYQTTNSKYGLAKTKSEEDPTVRKPKVSVLKETRVDPFKTKRAFEAHLQAVPTGHDLLNRDPQTKGVFESSARMDYYVPEPSEVPFEEVYEGVVTKYNPNGSAKSFARKSTFSVKALE
ncbi:Conserved_hypothetical protein [Hexamita inflata]|uniref:Uncharacterized protein n=1 Tax=Hexamita inflata TaxID=28002 RepID=A0AA86NFW0_9EUKA|nr:Conserved hypothetical protein [Hexamita inflata]CAI9920327.1 Conserved hypothetical protein [Hexamita inflata]CAI9952858.1 Conserved hypothetical protein [Hexamita inflata]